MHIYLPDLSNCSESEQPWFLQPEGGGNGTLVEPTGRRRGAQGDGLSLADDPDYLNKLHALTVFLVGVVGVLIVASLILCMFYKNDRMADLICRCRTVEEVYDRTGNSNIFFQPQVTNLKPLVTTLPILVAGGPIPPMGKRRTPRPSGQDSPEMSVNDPLEGMLSGRSVAIAMETRGTPVDGSDTGDPFSPEIYSPSTEGVDSPFMFPGSVEGDDPADSSHLTVPRYGATFDGF